MAVDGDHVRVAVEPSAEAMTQKEFPAPCSPDFGFSSLLPAALPGMTITLQLVMPAPNKYMFSKSALTELSSGCGQLLMPENRSKSKVESSRVTLSDLTPLLHFATTLVDRIYFFQTHASQ